MYRRRKNGKPVGNCYYWHPVTGRRVSTGTSDRILAKAIVSKAEREAVERKAGIFVPGFVQQTDTWLELNQSLAGYFNQEDYARFWKAHLQGRRLTEITADLIHSIIKRERTVDLKQPVKANTTANKYAQFVAKVIRSAGITPPKFHVYPQRRASKAWLLPAQWRLLEGAMRDDVRHIATFSLGTGLREANVVRFEWSWLHGDKAFLPREITKTSEAYGIPLNHTVMRVIDERKAMTVRHAKYVFLNRGEPWKRGAYLFAVQSAAERVGLPNVGVHTFRHTFASWLAQSGVSDSIRKRLGCWSIGSSADAAYLHFDVEWLREHVEKLDPLLTGGTDGREAVA